MNDKIKMTCGGTFNWYDQWVVIDIDLIEAYVEQCEISNSLAINEFERYKKQEIEEHEHGAKIFTHFRLIDGATFNAKDIMYIEFPKLNRHSTLVLIMSMFEKILKKLCEGINDLFELNKSFKKIPKESLLSSIKTYLSEVAGLQFTHELNEQWSDLMCLQSIRNSITHNFGRFERGTNSVIDFITKNKNISLAENREIYFNHKFLKDLIPDFRAFCIGLQQSIRDKNNIT